MDYTTTALIASIKRRGMIPSSQQTFQSADFITLADEELQSYILPLVMRMRSEYYVTYEDSSIGTSSVFPIPTRAIGGKVRQVALVDSAGNEYSVPQIAEEDKRFYRVTGNFNVPSFSFYFQGNNVVLIPAPTTTSTYTLRIYYYQRPNSLVAEADAAQITAINTGTKTITMAAVPSNLTAGVSADFINGSPNFDLRALDQEIASVTTTTITFTDALPSTLVVGDWVSLAQTSPIPQLPLELSSILAQRVTLKVLEALGDAQGVETAQARLKGMEDGAAHLLSPRSDGNPKKLLNRYSTLRTWARGFFY